MEPIREIRIASDVWPDADFELRTGGDGLNFRGYAAVFDSPSEDLGGFRETIAPGAFAKSLRRKKGDIRMFLNHDWNVVLASRGAGTMRLSEDAHGLFVDADLPDNEWGRPVRDAVARGDITSMSFGFNVPKGGETWTAERTERRLTEVYLHEVSPITAWPAYPATSASVRFLADLIDVEDDDLEEAVRVLFREDGTLSDEQRDLLMQAINARTATPYIPAETAEWLARLMSKKPA